MVDLGDGILRSALRAEAVGARLEVRLEDRLEHQLQRRLHDPICDRRAPQRTDLAARLRHRLLPHPLRSDPAALRSSRSPPSSPGSLVLMGPVNARRRTRTRIRRGLGTRAARGNPQRPSRRWPRTALWVGALLEQLRRPPVHRRLRLELTDRLRAATSSSFSGEVNPASSPRSMRSWRRHVLVVWSLIPRSSATSATLRPASTRSSTRRRNSSG
jgi:hypothetical protein